MDELLALGERSLGDLVAPSALDEERGAMRIDEQRSQVLAMSNWPRQVFANWLGPLLDGGEPLDLSLHVTPLESAAVARMLDHRLVQMQSARSINLRSGRLPAHEEELAYSDIEQLRSALERGDERAFSVASYLRVHGRSEEDLERRAERLQEDFGGVLAELRPALHEQWPGLLSCLPSGEDTLRRVRNMDSSSLATVLPFASSFRGDEQGVLYGRNLLNGGLVVLDPFARENANRVVLSPSGNGKSYFVKMEILRALGAGMGYYVIDPEREYDALCEALGGRMVRVAGSSAQHINPFDLPPADEDEPDPLASQVMALQGLIALMVGEGESGLDQREQGMLDRALYETYRRAGIGTDPASHGQPPPVLADLVAVLRDLEEPYALADRLERYASGSYARIFSERTSVTLDHPLVVFGLRDLEEELRPLAIYLIATHIWRAVRLRPQPRLLVIDEAWTLLQHGAGARFMAQLARQARKHWLGVVTITQDVGDFVNSAQGQTVLANSATKMLFRQDPSALEVIAERLRLSAQEREFLLGARPGQGLLIAGGMRAPLAIEASELEHELVTSDPAERGG